MINQILSKNFVEMECCSCGVIYFVGTNLDSNYRRTKETFYCPNGHTQTYVKSTEQLLRENLNGSEATVRMLKVDIESLRKLVKKLSRKGNK